MCTISLGNYTESAYIRYQIQSSVGLFQVDVSHQQVISPDFANRVTNRLRGVRQALARVCIDSKFKVTRTFDQNRHNILNRMVPTNICSEQQSMEHGMKSSVLAST